MNDLNFKLITEAIDDLKSGKVIIVTDDINRENEGDFVALADYITPEVVNFMVTHGRGLLCMPISKEIANSLNLLPMVHNNTDIFATNFTTSVDHISNTTGISAYDRYKTISEIINKNSKSEDFRKPGHIFPLVALDNGVLERTGHTEATVDLARIAKSSSAGVICEIMNDDGTMARNSDLENIAKKYNLKKISIQMLIDYRKAYDSLLIREVVTELPTRFGIFNAYGYTNIVTKQEIIVLVKGDPTQYKTPPVVRIHSQCLTGDVFHSLRCDCGEQLEIILEQINKDNAGIVIYLPQEGRGIGLVNKLKAYKLQDRGFDTYDANINLGFSADAREYYEAAQVLKNLKQLEIYLATNNPEKINALMKYGINVIQRVSIETKVQKYNEDYILTKKNKFGHFLKESN